MGKVHEEPKLMCLKNRSHIVYNILKEMEKRDMSVEAVAGNINMSPNRFRQVLLGKYEFPVILLTQIAALFQWNITYTISKNLVIDYTEGVW